MGCGILIIQPITNHQSIQSFQQSRIVAHMNVYLHHSVHHCVTRDSDD